MTEAILLTLLGMGVVFFVLLLISFMIQGFAVFSGKPAAAPVSEPSAPAATAVEDKSEETTAAIMAAITAYMGSTNFKVKSITPLVVRPLVSYQGDSAWSAAGIAENTRR